MGALVIWGFAILVVGIVVAMFLVLAKVWAAYVVVLVAEPTPATSAGAIGLAIALVAGSIFLEPFLTSLAPALGIVLVALPFGALGAAVVRTGIGKLADAERRQRVLVAAGAVGALVGVAVAVHGLPAWREHERAAGAPRWAGAEPLATADGAIVGEDVDAGRTDAGREPVSLGELRLCPCEPPTLPEGPAPCPADHAWLVSERAIDHFCASLVQAPGVALDEPMMLHVEHEVVRADGPGWALLGSQEIGPVDATGSLHFFLPYRPAERVRVVVRTLSHSASATAELPAP